jgi:hypothetical protein
MIRKLKITIEYEYDVNRLDDHYIELEEELQSLRQNPEHIEDIIYSDGCIITVSGKDE